MVTKRKTTSALQCIHCHGTGKAPKPRKVREWDKSWLEGSPKKAGIYECAIVPYGHVKAKWTGKKWEQYQNYGLYAKPLKYRSY
jgi:cytochrome c5